MVSQYLPDTCILPNGITISFIFGWFTRGWIKQGNWYYRYYLNGLHWLYSSWWLYGGYDMYEYEKYNSTYHKVNSGCIDRSGGELSTQSIQGIFDSRADNLNNNKI